MLHSSKGLLIHDPDSDVDENMDGGPLEQVYERGWADAEEREEYRPGGFHPVHIGDRFVWLCRDQDTQEYVALKIIIADESRENSSDLRLVNRKGLDFGEAGGEYIAIPREHFWHDGPNGRHLCLVLPVLGPEATILWGKFEDPVKVSRDVALQVTKGLNFLHKKGICHGDLRPSNVLLRLIGFDELNEDDLIQQVGEPRKEPLATISGESPAPAGPEYIVESLGLDRLDARFISNQVSIIDFGESYDMQNPPEDLGVTAGFRSPELLFDNTIGVGCDLWALACTVFEIRTISPLFDNFMDDDDEIIMQMVALLGQLPEPWWSSWEARGHFYEEDGTPLLSPETGRPFLMISTLEGLFTYNPPSEYDPDKKKNIAGGRVVPAEESHVLANLLRSILKYNPKERPSVETILEHPWFKR